MAPQGSHLPTLESSAGHRISLACGVGEVDEGPASYALRWRRLVGAVRGRPRSSLPWPDWVGRQRQRKALADLDTVSLRFLQANPLEVNCYSDVLKGKIPVNIYRMLYGEGWEEEGANWDGEKRKGQRDGGRQRRKGEGSVLEPTFRIGRSCRVAMFREHPPATRPENFTWEGLDGILALLPKEASPGLVVSSCLELYIG